MVVTFLMLVFVFGANVMSKLSFLSLAEKFKRNKDEAKNRPDEYPDAAKEAHAALLILVFVMLIPQVLGVLQSAWTICYKVKSVIFCSIVHG